MTANQARITLCRWIATFLGAGYSPKLPGTVGTAAAIPLFLLIRGLSLLWYLAVVCAISLAGVYTSSEMEKEWGKDPSRVVIDEVAGFLLALVSRPRKWQIILYAFVIFRALDILKPPPVGTIDKKVEGGLGIMGDDLVAGGITALILGVVKFLVKG